MLIACPRAAAALRVASAVLPLAALALCGSARADTLTQSDWSAGPGLSSSNDLSGEVGFASATGQWSHEVSGELRATTVAFVRATDGTTRALRVVASATTAEQYVGFTGCAITLAAPPPTCREAHVFVHRDTTTGVLSLVTVADGSGQMGCAAGFDARFTASPGVELVYADEPGEVTLVAGAGAVGHSWSTGCADGFILTLPGTGAVVSGAITARTNLQSFLVFADVATAAAVNLPLGTLPNNGAAGTEVPFEFRSGLLSSLESAVFSLGGARQLQALELDATTASATLLVFVRTGSSVNALSTAPWSGPFTDGASLSGVPSGAFVQYRVDATLLDTSTTPGAPEPYATLEELRLEYGAPCPCAIGATCYADGEPNPSNPCEQCNASVSATAWSARDGVPCDDGRFCTADDQCLAGTCTGGASPCGDGLSCTDDACDEAQGTCSNVVASGCVIASVCVPAGATNPSDACELCDPARPLQWSLAPTCTGCNTSADCTTPGLSVCDLEDHACVACSAEDSSACDLLHPVCDPATRSCRACVSDQDCGPTSGLRCASDGRCVACVSHLDCPASAPICTSGGCSVCFISAECLDRDPGAGLCDAETGRCGSCLDDDACRAAVAGGVCVYGTDGRRCGCLAEADCGPGTTCDVPRRRCAPLATADSDGDGVPDDKDADDDDDGITDLVEGGGYDFSLDFDQDGIPNWRDTDSPRFVDENQDGTDDLSDADGDGVPNQLDLDSDGDGVPDLLENAGRDVLDLDRDGRLDDTRDADRDGLHATADADDGDVTLITSVIPSRDTDADGTPDYLDPDADAEGANDTVEAGGVDGNGDGRLDGAGDTNMNGLADRVDPSVGGEPLPLPDSDGDGAWDFQDDSDAPRIIVAGGGLCSLGAPRAGWEHAWGALLLALGLARRRRSARPPR
ncbi:MAG: hypothetical protein H6725_09235 [Sandaracinaceae bacterium]|nr:hypothetical protein [Sandaracinaceae bacterium]